MKKKKKNKKISRHPAFWLAVLFLGTAIGLSVQFSRAWVEPSSTLTPPEGNIAAPINTGASKQVKEGDICTTVTGTEVCLSSLKDPEFLKCTLMGGTEVEVDGVTVCRFPSNVCPTGWTQYQSLTETAPNTCVGTESGCSGATTVTTGWHPLANIDPATEARTYYNTSSYSYIAYWEWVWVQTCCCWWPCDSSYQTPVYTTGCTTTANTCMPTTTAVGCVSD